MSTSLLDLPIQQQEKRGGGTQPQTAATNPTTFPSVPSHLYSNHSSYSNYSQDNNNNTDPSPFTTNTAAFNSPYGGLKQVSAPYEQGQTVSGVSSYSSPSPSAQQPSSSWTPPPPPPTQQLSSYQPPSNSNPSNYHPYQQQPPVIQLTADGQKPTTTAYPWAVHSSAASSVSVSDLPNALPTPTTTSQFHPRHYSERRRLIHSFQSSVDTSSRPQTPVAMESRPPLLLSSDGNNNDNKDDYRPAGTHSPRRSLETLSGSGSPVLNKTAKKPFWKFFPRRFRPKGAVRPKKSDSFGNRKAKFSNERTLVHWIKAAMLLGSLSMTLLSFGENQVTPYIGAVLITICCMTLVYSVTIFQVRMEWLQMRRDDVIYYDRRAPTVITALLMLTFGFNAVGE